jgi:hypothetical protein
VVCSVELVSVPAELVVAAGAPLEAAGGPLVGEDLDTTAAVS